MAVINANVSGGRGHKDLALILEGGVDLSDGHGEVVGVGVPYESIAPSKANLHRPPQPTHHILSFMNILGMKLS
ncbi:hypothetical protein SESBI_00611 [Sesbania bispinosa]|nr:hypothetical protein SESBI_00611 [Sesbania bispinosa]